MSSWTDCEPTSKEVEEILREEIESASTIEGWKHVTLNGKISKCNNAHEMTDFWWEKGMTIIRTAIAKIETPEDGFALHLRLKALGIYSKTIQEELAEKIRDVVAKWHPPFGYGSYIQD